MVEPKREARKMTCYKTTLDDLIAGVSGDDNAVDWLESLRGYVNTAYGACSDLNAVIPIPREIFANYGLGNDNHTLYGDAVFACRACGTVEVD